MSLKCPKMSAAKCQVGSFDASKLTLGQFAANGVLTNPGISIFGESLQFGVVRAGVTIGLPMAIPGLTLPMSLEVTGVSMIWGELTVNAVHLAYGLKTSFAPNIKNSYTAKNKSDINNSLSVRNKTSIFNGISKFNGKVLAELITAKKVVSVKFLGDVNGCVGVPAGCKPAPFDMPHWKTKGKRIRHICTEGPEAGIYIRGRLKDSNVIELPEYWDGLVDYDSISVNLTPFGSHQELFVESINNDRVTVANNSAAPIDCFYQVWVARWVNPITQEKLHVVYDGMSPDDYPGDNTGFVIGGWDYDRRQTQWPHHLEENE